MKQEVVIVKVGGKVLEVPEMLEKLLRNFSSIQSMKILVHGGGRTATDLAVKLGVESRMVDGRRVTDGAMLRIVTMVYGGLVNRHMVARLQGLGVNALGLTGADLGVVRSRRRPVTDGIDYGYVGDVERVDAGRLSELLRQGVTPVLAPLTYDGEGGLLNTNADTIAGEAAKALAEEFSVTLVYCFEHPGVLADPRKGNGIVPIITRPLFRHLKETGVVSGGMIPKIENCLEAVAAGVRRVIITQADSVGTFGGTLIQ